MPTLKIDDHEITVEPGTTVIEAARRLKISVPHFCYHPHLSIAGNCRMCLVEVEKFPKPQIACSLVATDGMVVKTQSENAQKWRKNVLEFILINHPLDCPVCDQAGECKLQNYYLAHSVKGSQFEEEKVHKPKKVRLGPLVMLDDERCIMCSRCIRFCDEVSKTSELGFIQRGDHVELRPFPGKELNNPYSLNTVDICPVGALTNADFRFKCRVWFLKTAESICSGCSRGCNIRLQHHEGKVQRYLPRENQEVNKVWLCDAGRLSYREINENRRIEPEKRIQEQFEFIAPDSVILEICAKVKSLITEASSTHSTKVLGIGNAQYSNENNAALKALIEKIDPNAPLFYSAKFVENPDEDEILIKADKNPNRKGVEDLGFKAIEKTVPNASIVFLLGNLSDPERKIFETLKPNLTVVFSSHTDQSLKIADYILPITLFAEESGTFTNFEGRVQQFKPGPAPKGQMQPAKAWMDQIIQKIGSIL